MGSLQECHNKCIQSEQEDDDVAMKGAVDPGTDNNNDFSLPKCQQDKLKSGVGRAFIPRWSFNKEAQACESVIWGGMGALNTDNTFDNEEDCKSECIVNV